MPPSPVRLVLISYATHPDMGSEPGVGWSFLVAALKWAGKTDARVTLVCNARSADAVRRETDRLPDLATRLTVREVGFPVEGWMHPSLERLLYLLWVFRVRRLLRSFISSATAHTVFHQVTYASEILPVALPALKGCGASRIWGPIGSTGDPKIFYVAPSHVAYLMSGFAQAARNFAASRLARKNAARCELVLAQSEAAARTIASGQTRHAVFPNFVPPEGFSDEQPLPGASPSRAQECEPRRFRLAVIGQLKRLKRVDLAIQALSQPALDQAVLRVAGSGPEEKRLRKLALRLGVADRVQWLGEVPRSQVALLLLGSDALIHLSAREGASGVVAEASILGTPVACFSTSGSGATLAYGGGPGIAVDPSHGLSLEDVAQAIASCARLPRRPSNTWSRDRIDRLVDAIYPNPLSGA